MLQKVSSLDGIIEGDILYDNPDELQANRFSILDIHENVIRILQTETKTMLKIFSTSNLLSEDWWISGNEHH